MTETSLDTSLISVFNTESHLKCNSNQQAVLMCISTKCTSKNVFQCFDKQCECQQIHIKCRIGKFKPVIQMIDSKLNIAGPLKQAVKSMITKIIDQLSLLEESLHLKIDKELKQGYLTKLEHNFQLLFKGQMKYDQFSSLNADKIWTMATEQVKPINKMVEKLNTHLKSFDQHIQKSMKDLKDKVNGLNPSNQSNTTNAILKEIMKKSAICTTQQLSQAFVSMFSKKIKRMEYMSCASKNQFSLPKYFQVCGKLFHTVIVCKTNMDKIIGAYTPLKHDEEDYNTYIGDPSGESFIFSLTDRQKFSLKDKQNTEAIYRYKNKRGIAFGAWSFDIFDKSNQISCRARVNSSDYYCSSNSVNDKAAYLKFNGNQTEYFTTKEWQVWRVEFIQ